VLELLVKVFKVEPITLADGIQVVEEAVLVLLVVTLLLVQKVAKVVLV
jgi:hypothetical protein